jgi:hypothetical protein
MLLPSLGALTQPVQRNARVKAPEPLGEEKATSSTRHRGPSPQAAQVRGKQLEAVQIVANSYCLRHYRVGYSGGNSRRLSLGGVRLWIVSVLLTSPVYGAVGDVGLVAIDAATQEVLGATPSQEVRAAGNALAEPKRDGLQAAFRQARKA